jgi:hypothetical protein
MSIQVGSYVFGGPYKYTSALEDRSGVYVILCSSNGKYTLVDVGESATVKTRVETHERKSCWSRNCHSELMVAVLYTPHLQQSGRIEIEKKIRNSYDLPCGKL